ncbi:PREDICTED: NADH dehydrogenase [ubiquinone] iron-sulfur protein 5 [Nanorana parkeri]|uniref:NADH dehydrogenase [ubiquinone] iron-sulfur protein 5 n=1 Tax=Nanorana parkeri TaxID=125878 RepID=UPI000854E148|nr:PREDICTED: NADH dehydrogenase [ubiquinone] iron-sulfur protein 5 [Nanorana parkeri]XP_018420021.1 PREDICTED: NADH dehydrogenase [ubiquinone] iron-sulfur protein 5 [Nanorana parkeri]
MPFIDLQSKLGIDVDKWLLLQSGKQADHNAGRCHAFEKEWVECAHGIGQVRAEKECKLEYEDFLECMHRTKTLERLKTIRNQMKKLEKEGKYKAPDFSKDENTP